jgi:hypothetical protein
LIKVSPQSGRQITTINPAHGEFSMFAAASRLVPLAGKFCRQVVPPVIATLIAAGLIQAYNRTFSGHLTQPRMGALHAEEGPPAAPITTVGMSKPPAPPMPPVTETITIYEDVIAPERLTDKDAREEAGKDQTVRLAVDPAPAPTPVRTVSPAPRPEPKFEPRPEPHRVAAVELPQPVIRAPVPVVVAVPPPVVAAPTSAPVVAAMPPAQERVQPQVPPPVIMGTPQYPPPAIMGAPPVVTVPDRPNARPVEEAQVAPPAPPRGAMGTFVHVLKPSTWFAHAREFGEKIEQVGNEILPSIRQ